MTDKIENKRGGRPPAQIDWDMVDNFLKAQCDGVGIASYFGVAPDTLYRLTKERYNIGFDDYRRQKQSEGCELLRAKQFQSAMAGDKTMLVWLGKQYLHQREKTDVTTDGEKINLPPVIVDSKEHAKMIESLSND